LFLNQINADEFLIDCGLDTSYFLELQHASASVEVSSNISDHSDHTSSSNDATPSNVTSENKELNMIGNVVN
jgi:hypothetical protein